MLLRSSSSRTPSTTTVGAAVVALAILTGCSGPGGAAATAVPAGPAPQPASVTVRVAAAPAPAASSTAAPLVRRGDSGPQVAQVQQRLTSLGYWLGVPDGVFGALTEQAVLAVQGAAGLPRDGVVGPLTRRALDAGVVPVPSTRQGHAVEVDRDAGLLLVVDDGRVRMVLHTSTGTFQHYTYGGRRYLADTPAGSFRVSWAYDGWRSGALGRLYRPRYFHPDGIAVHGYPSVPAYPASHGCARVSVAAMDVLWAQGLMPVGSTVVVR